MDFNNIDQDALNLTKAIRQVESGGNPNAVGDRGTSTGAYQWQPGNYEAMAKKYGLDPNDRSLKTQNKVAYAQIKEWKDLGHSADQIAAAWNMGAGTLGNDKWKTNKGFNQKLGIEYDTPAYVGKVKGEYQKLKGVQPAQQPELTPENFISKMDQRAAEINKPEESSEIGKDIVGAFTDPLATAGFGLSNVIRPLIGKDVKPTYTNPLTGRDVDPMGYSKGEKLDTYGTAKQAAGTAAEVAGLAIAGPELKAASTLFKASPILKQVARSAVQTAPGAGLAMGGAELREEQNIPSALFEGVKGLGVGAFGGGVLAGGATAVGQLLKKPQEFEKAFELAVKTGDKDMADEVLTSPMGRKYLGSVGLTPEALPEYNKQLVDSVKDTIYNNYASNPKMIANLDKNLTDEAIETNLAYFKPKVVGKGLDISDSVRAKVADQEKLMSKKNDLMDVMSRAGIDTNISRIDIEREAMKAIDDYAKTNTNINKGSVFKYITNQLDNTGENVIGLKTQDKLRLDANKNWVLSDDPTNAQAAAKILGDVMRDHTDNLIQRGVENGVIDSTAIQTYRNLNAAWGKIQNALEIDKLLTRSIKTKSAGLYPDFVGALAAGGFNPLVYIGTKLAVKKIIEDRSKFEILKKFNTKGYKFVNTDIKDALTNADAVIDNLKGVSANKATQQLESRVSAEALDKIVKEKSLEPHIPDEQLPTIDFGKPAKSKFNKADSSLPTIQLGKNPKGFANNQLMQILAAGTMATGAVAPELKRILNVLQNKYGKVTYEREPEQEDKIDITDYATDPEHEKKVMAIYDKMPKMATSTDADNYINNIKTKYGHDIKITGEMILKAAKMYDVSMELLMALMQNDSMFGTTGIGKDSNNPGNIGNDDTGRVMKYPTMQDGVNAVARTLARFRAKQQGKEFNEVGNAKRIK